MGCRARYADASHPPLCPAHWLPPLFFLPRTPRHKLNLLVHCRSPLRHFRLRPLTWPALFPPGETSRPRFNEAALCERQLDAVFRLMSQGGMSSGERSCRVYLGVAGEQRPGVHNLSAALSVKASLLCTIAGGVFDCHKRGTASPAAAVRCDCI